MQFFFCYFSGFESLNLFEFCGLNICVFKNWNLFVF
jgi:hypothetical protein